MIERMILNTKHHQILTARRHGFRFKIFRFIQNQLRQRVNKFFGIIQAFGNFKLLDARLLCEMFELDADFKQRFEMVGRERNRHGKHIFDALRGEAFNRVGR